MSTLDTLDRAANQAASSGRWDEAERLWIEMRGQQPDNRNALWGLGFSALQKGDIAKAQQMLGAAHRAAPDDKIVLFTLSMAHKQAGDDPAEHEALTAALSIDPYFLQALLAKAALLERQGQPDAPTVYGNALKIAPPQPQWPPDLKPQLEHAKRLVEQHRQALFNTLSSAVADVARDMPEVQRERWREAASIMAKLTTPYHSESAQLFVPRLPATPFYDRMLFPWAAEVESKTDIIREELLNALQSKRDDFVPYINKDSGTPVSQWGELNHSLRWSVLHLWEYGEPVEEHLALCPETARVLARVDQAHIAGNCPNAMFSALAPHTRIPAHTGETNARLVVHLPLIVPEKCKFRVGFETREWKVGELMFFDDSIEHEAWNDSDELRVVLIFDVWNPLLSAQDREMVNALTIAASGFRG